MDYSKLVPVTLSNDKTKISSFPHPKDVYYNGELAYPTQLEEGLFIGLIAGFLQNVAFLNIYLCGI